MPEKFIGPFIEMVAQHFNLHEHRFLIRGRRGNYQIPKLAQVEMLTSGSMHPKTLWALFQAFRKAERIILHGLFCRSTLLLLWLFPVFRRKSFWFTWGGDIYAATQRDLTGNRRWRQVLRRIVIPDIRFLVCHIRGDAERCWRWYGARGTALRCHKYPSNSVASPSPFYRAADHTLTVQIGNSATAENAHKRIFSLLMPYRNIPMRILCPLAYGNRNYAQSVATRGAQEFGAQFEPQTEFLPREDYLTHIGNVDIAVFANQRQQAMGTTITLLANGTKIYLNPRSTVYRHLIDLGITVFRLDEFTLNADFPQRETNQQRVASLYSNGRLVSDLASIFRMPLHGRGRQ